MNRYLFILFHCLIGLFQAWSIKISKNIGKVSLPAVGMHREISNEDLTCLTRLVRRTVRLGGTGTDHKCFFHSYIIASVLRKLGVPVTINVGLKIFGSASKTEGHCWVTMEDGSPVAESCDPMEEFPDLIGSGNNGILYWIDLYRQNSRNVIR